MLFHQSHSSSSLFKPRIIFFQRIYFHSKTLQGCIHVALVIWQIRFFSIVGLVLRPSHVGNTFQPCMAVTHVLFVDDESRGDSIFQFACFLFHVIERSFHKFMFLARPSFSSSRQTVESSRFSFTASSCPFFPFFCRVLRKESKHKERENKR